MLPYLAAGAALVFAGYHTMSPQSQLYGRTFTGEPRPSRRLALTFDDGPDTTSTPRLLDTLAQHGVRATFFMIGAHVVRRPEIARAVAEAGHVIGNHTLTHLLLTLRSRAAIAAELRDCQRALADAVGPHSRLFRPPYGGRRPAVLREAREQGLLPVMWRIAGYDWRTQSAAKIERNVLRQVRGGEVILLHDGAPGIPAADRAGTVAAVARLIPVLKQQGFEFVTVPEMMGN